MARAERMTMAIGRADWATWQGRLLAAAGLIVALAFVAVAARGWPLMRDLVDYPFQVDYGEGIVVSQVAELAAGRELYPASDREGGPGFVGANYPPVYYLLLWLLPDRPSGPYADARLVSLAGYVAVAALAGLLAARTSGWPAAGAIAAAAVLALPPAREWGVFAKPDLLALAFSTAGLAVAALAPRRVLWAAPLFALGLLTKQTAVAAPLAVGLWLLATPGRRREALALGGLTTLLTLAPLALLELGPQEVTWHLVAANARGWAFGRFDDIGLRFLEIYRPLLAAALALLLFRPWRPQTPLAWYLPLALATLLAAGLPGSSRNYAIEAGLALAVAAAIAVGWLARGAGWRRWAAMAGLALLLLQAGGLWNLSERAFGRRPPSAETTDRLEVMLDYLRGEAPAVVLSENVGLLVQAGLPIEYHDPSLMHKLANAGTWDQEPLLAQLRNQHFDVIMTEVNLETSPERSGRWTSEVVATIREHYRVLHRDVLVIYVPRRP